MPSARATTRPFAKPRVVPGNVEGRRHDDKTTLLWILLVAAMLTACARRDDSVARELTGGDPDRGVVAIGRYGCGSCHEIPGVRRGDGTVGPPLTGIAYRSYLAGRVSNTPADMIRWIQHPQQIEPGTAMPDMKVTDADARDIAAYLYSLR